MANLVIRGNVPGRMLAVAMVMAHAATSPPVLPLWIAVEKDFFVREGLDLERCRSVSSRSESTS
jgi:hypothetical protein